MCHTSYRNNHTVEDHIYIDCMSPGCMKQIKYCEVKWFTIRDDEDPEGYVSFPFHIHCYWKMIFGPNWQKYI